LNAHGVHERLTGEVGQAAGGQVTCAGQRRAEELQEVRCCGEVYVDERGVQVVDGENVLGQSERVIQIYVVKIMTFSLINNDY
jgi:hypothetical protein